MRPDDPSLLTPADRLREVATILARGVLRLHARAALDPAPAAEKPANSSAAGLEVPSESWLSVHTG